MAEMLDTSNSDTASNCASENSDCKLILLNYSSDAFSDGGDGAESLEVLSETLEPYLYKPFASDSSPSEASTEISDDSLDSKRLLSTDW